MTEVRVAIIGGGITGLATAAWLEHDHGIRDAMVLEAEPRVGGKIETRIDAGHRVEWGPQGFLDSAPDTIDLARLAGIDDRLAVASHQADDRFVVRAGRLRRLPTSPAAFLGSDVLTLPGRLRVLCEPFARRRPEHDETVFDFAHRRIGRRAAEILVDAMVTGVFAGSSRQLSLAATFPRMAEMEAAHGSLTRALVARMRAARRDGRTSSGPAGPAGTLTSFRDGMVELPRAIGKLLGDRLLLSTPVWSIEPSDRGFRISTGSGGYRSGAILLTTPADQTSRLLAPFAPAVAEPLARIPTVPIAVVMTSYSDLGAFGRPIRGFGFLVPGTELLDILGTLYCHAIFPDHAPADRLFLRTMVGGARDPAAVDLSDEELVARTRRSLRAVLGADPEPSQLWIVRWPEGISQYTVGHLDRVAAVESAARAVGVEVAGSPYRGVSVNDCIKQARAAARRIAERLAGSAEC
jgi:oxygen-dependent protoporphyrinogen oxidase